MSKKTNRSVRALQAQRSSTMGGERKNTARPLVDLEKSSLAVDTSELAVNTEELESQAVTPAKERAATARPGVYEAPSSGTTATVIRPASSGPRRPYARRTTAVNRQPAISRQEEYEFIRSDLMAVFLLTVFLFIVLIVLTFVIGR